MVWIWFLIYHAFVLVEYSWFINEFCLFKLSDALLIPTLVELERWDYSGNFQSTSINSWKSRMMLEKINLEIFGMYDLFNGFDTSHSQNPSVAMDGNYFCWDLVNIWKNLANKYWLII